MAPSESAPDLRSRIAQDLEAAYDEKIVGFFDDALRATKDTWATCSKCNHRTQVEIPDWSARTHALRLLLEQGYGRPRVEAPGGQTVTLLVKRNWPLDAEEIVALLNDEEPAEHLRYSEGTRQSCEEIKRGLLAAGWTPPRVPLEGGLT